MSAQSQVVGKETTLDRTRRLVDDANRDAGPDAVRLGVLTPLTGPGDEVAGELVVRGAVLAAEYLRERGGRRVELVLQNDQQWTDEGSMAESAARGLRTLVEQEGVVGVFGQWHLRTTAAVADAAEDLGVPIFIENGHSTVTKGRRTVFRTYFSIADRVPLMLDFLAAQGLRRLGIVAADTVFGLMTADELEEYGRERHGMEFLRFDFPQEEVQDIRAELRQIAEWGPDALINDGVVRTNYLFLRQAVELGLRPAVPMMVTFGYPMRSADFWRLSGPEGNGILWPGTRFRPSWEGLTDVGRWFIDRYAKRFGDFPPDTCMSAFTDVTIFVRAVDRAGSQLHEHVIDALEAGEFDTWRGTVRFERGADHWHHDRPELVLFQYQQVDQGFDDAEIVWPQESATAPYRSPAELA